MLIRPTRTSFNNWYRWDKRLLYHDNRKVRLGAFHSRVANHISQIANGARGPRASSAEVLSLRWRRHASSWEPFSPLFTRLCTRASRRCEPPAERVSHQRDPFASALNNEFAASLLFTRCCISRIERCIAVFRKSESGRWHNCDSRSLDKRIDEGHD
jgi:hypothetical protein